MNDDKWTKNGCRLISRNQTLLAVKYIKHDRGNDLKNTQGNCTFHLHTVCFIIQYITNIISLEFPCFVHLPFDYSILQSSDVNSVWRINKFLLASYCYYYHHHYYVCKVHILLFLVTLGLLALQRYVFVCILFLIQCITLGLQTWKGSVFPLF